MSESSSSLDLHQATASSSGGASAHAGKHGAGGGRDEDPNRPGSREQRILARRARINNNRANAAALSDSETNASRRIKKETEKSETFKSAAQVKESKERLLHVKENGVNDVTQFRVNAAQREQKRRTEESMRSEILGKKSKECAATTDKLIEEIKQAWNKSVAMSQTLSTPHELHKMLVDQQALCARLLQAKENLIIEHNAELKRKDDEYVKELKRQAEEIEQLLVKMDQQFATFKKSLREEVVSIERAFMEERSELIEKNIKEIEDLFQTRKDNEMRYLEERSKRVYDNSEALDELRVQDAEEYNLVKIKLETDVQVLEQQLQQMKATYQLNMEKLEYNYQVLKKRDDENSITVNQQKRRITRMTDILNTLRTRLAKQEKQYSTDHSALQEDYNRISSQYEELTKKFKHFQVNDEVKFQELWEMNQHTIKELVAKVLKADSVIYQQQLGLPWEPPRVAKALSAAPGSHGRASDVGDAGVLGALAAEMRAGDNSAGGDPALSGGTSPLERSKGSGGGGLVAGDRSARSSSESVAKLLLSSKNQVVQRILQMLSTEASFLLDDKLTRLLAPLPEYERALLKVDTILKALDVASNADLERFFELFLQPKFHASASDLTALVLSGGTGSEDGDAEVDETMLIHPNQVIKVISRFLRESQARGGTAGGSAGAASDDAVHGAHGAGTSGEVDEGEASAGPSKEDLKAHWKDIMEMLDGERFRNWQTVYECMESYHLLLSARKELTVEVTSLETQNMELKNMLREYLSADVNKSLHVPPSQVILSQVQRASSKAQQQQQQQQLQQQLQPKK